MENTVRDTFSQIAASYNTHRRAIIPCFDDFYQLPVQWAGYHLKKANPYILDLGAGTGLFTSYFANQFHKANFTLLDFSEEMLEQAKRTFTDRTRFNFVVGDYSKLELPATFDLVISALSIHHLEDQQKKELFSHIYKHLNTGGLFINADLFLATTQPNEAINQLNWKLFIEKGILTKNEKANAFERMKMDKPCTINHFLTSLAEVGFRNADVLYKYFNFGIVTAQKY